MIMKRSIWSKTEAFKHDSVPYHIILGFAISYNYSNAVLHLAGSLGGGEDVVHCKLNGPACLEDRRNLIQSGQKTA